MTTLTFLRKFTARFALGLAVLSLPNIVLATAGGDGEGAAPQTHPPLHRGGNHSPSGGGEQGGESTSVKITVDPATLDQVNSILTSLSSSGCTQASSASSALSSLIGS